MVDFSNGGKITFSNVFILGAVLAACTWATQTIYKSIENDAVMSTSLATKAEDDKRFLDRAKEANTREKDQIIDRIATLEHQQFELALAVAKLEKK